MAGPQWTLKGKRAMSRRYAQRGQEAVLKTEQDAVALEPQSARGTTIDGPTQARSCTSSAAPVQCFRWSVSASRVNRQLGTTCSRIVARCRKGRSMPVCRRLAAHACTSAACNPGVSRMSRAATSAIEAPEEIRNDTAAGLCFALPALTKRMHELFALVEIHKRLFQTLGMFFVVPAEGL